MLHFLSGTSGVFDEVAPLTAEPPHRHRRVVWFVVTGHTLSTNAGSESKQSTILTIALFCNLTSDQSILYSPTICHTIAGEKYLQRNKL